MNAPSGKWADLAPRLGSAVVMIAVGGAAIWAGGPWLRGLLVAAVALMIWELLRLSGSRFALAGGAIMALAMGLVLFAGQPLALLGAPVIVAALDGRALAGLGARIALPAYGAAIGIAAVLLGGLRDGKGLTAVLWLIGTVVISDIAGYAVGRLLGGPKFWPAISPKKTWSGTVAGWIGAAALGAALGGAALALVSVLVAFAGQMGDIAESALKRRAGVKDSSHLIPGHGGFLDRFDAVIGAALALFVIAQLGLMPGFGG